MQCSHCATLINHLHTQPKLADLTTYRAHLHLDWTGIYWHHHGADVELPLQLQKELQLMATVSMEIAVYTLTIWLWRTAQARTCKVYLIMLMPIAMTMMEHSALGRHMSHWFHSVSDAVCMEWKYWTWLHRSYAASLYIFHMYSIFVCWCSIYILSPSPIAAKPVIGAKSQIPSVSRLVLYNGALKGGRTSLSYSHTGRPLQYVDMTWCVNITNSLYSIKNRSDSTELSFIQSKLGELDGPLSVVRATLIVSLHIAESHLNVTHQDNATVDFNILKISK